MHKPTTQHKAEGSLGTDKVAPKLSIKKTEAGATQRRFSPLKLAWGGAIAALYMLLTLPLCSISYGIVQFRLAEALTVLPAFTSAAVPGLFVGCFLSNVLNPANLGIVDILGGSLTTLVAAALTHILARPYRKIVAARRSKQWKDSEGAVWKLRFLRFLILLPPVLLNAVVVGTYLPQLLLDHPPSTVETIGSIASIFLSQTVVVYAPGLALLLSMEKLKLPLDSDSA